MNFRVFAMERWQSTYEHAVEYNLSESGVHPATLADIGIDPQELAAIRLGYSASNGTERFRSLAASLQNDASAENVLVTIGGIEANFHAVARLISPGDEALLLLPNYMQIHGLVESLGGRVIPVWNRLENNWIPDPDEIAKKITSKTKFISLSNPNNPSAAVFGSDVIKAIASVADKHGCWILSDEVYRGAERNGQITPSFWEHYPTTIVNQFLQGKFKEGGQDTARFLLNTTLGWGGLIDVASGGTKLPKHDEDSGQTLGRWGVPAGPYLMLPFLGPATVRDTPARIVDDFTQPFRWYDWGSERWLSLGLSFVDKRAQFLPLDKTLEQTYDPYAFIRNAYLQRRQYSVYDGDPPEDKLPEEDDDWAEEALKESEEPAADDSAPTEPSPPNKP